MTIKIREIEESEYESWSTVTSTAFGEPLTDEERQDELELIDFERFLGAEENGRFVGAAGAFAFDMTVPGGSSLPVAGVTWVGVLPTHRRRGVLTSMMRRQLDDVVAWGEPIAVLTASEAPIYGRFGYGLSTRLAKVRIDTTRGLPLTSPPSVGGGFRMVDGDEGSTEAKRLLADVVPQRVGELTRPERWWPQFLRDREKSRHGASARFWVVHESSAGGVDGVAWYRIKEHFGADDAIARNEVRLGEVFAADPDVEAALLVFLTEIDLTTHLTTWQRPVDDPFRLRMADDRRYRVELFHDHLYVRLLDIETALSARDYANDDEVVLGVDDGFRPSSSGRYRVAGGKAERVGDLHEGDADVFLTIDALGSLYLGDVTVRQLVDASRARPSSPEGLARVDRLFRTDGAPYCTMHF